MTAAPHTPAEARADLVDLIWTALSNAHDMDVTLLDYANAVADALEAERRAPDEKDAEIARLREALAEIAADAEVPQQFYDRNGPTWTSKSGAEYEDTSAHLDKCNELAAAARAAISPT